MGNDGCRGVSLNSWLPLQRREVRPPRVWLRRFYRTRQMNCFVNVMPRTQPAKLNRSDPKPSGERRHGTTRAQTEAMENEGQGQPQARSQIFRSSSGPKNPVRHVPRRRSSPGSVSPDNLRSQPRVPDATPIGTGGHGVTTVERRRAPVPRRGDVTDDRDSDRRGEHRYPGDETGPDGAPRRNRDALTERMRGAKGSFRR